MTLNNIGLSFFVLILKSYIVLAPAYITMKNPIMAKKATEPHNVSSSFSIKYQPNVRLKLRGLGAFGEQPPA